MPLQFMAVEETSALRVSRPAAERADGGGDSRCVRSHGWARAVRGHLPVHTTGALLEGSVHAWVGVHSAVSVADMRRPSVDRGSCNHGFG